MKMQVHVDGSLILLGARLRPFDKIIFTVKNSGEDSADKQLYGSTLPNAKSRPHMDPRPGRTITTVSNENRSRAQGCTVKLIEKTTLEIESYLPYKYLRKKIRTKKLFLETKFQVFLGHKQNLFLHKNCVLLSSNAISIGIDQILNTILTF